ncbi:hypothetical protein DF41_00475 [Raoultella planticola]|nr:hypothetical protein DF41_00475 [Raoultella planticola]
MISDLIFHHAISQPDNKRSLGDANEYIFVSTQRNHALQNDNRFGAMYIINKYNLFFTTKLEVSAISGQVLI